MKITFFFRNVAQFLNKRRFFFNPSCIALCFFFANKHRLVLMSFMLLLILDLFIRKINLWLITFIFLITLFPSNFNPFQFFHSSHHIFDKLPDVNIYKYLYFRFYYPAKEEIPSMLTIDLHLWSMIDLKVSKICKIHQ